MYDVDAMIQAADLEALLSELGVEIDRRKNSRGYELYFHCINPQHDDTKKKMSMAESGKYKGLFNCWSCKWHGNIIQVVQYFLGIGFYEALMWVQQRTGVGQIVGTQSLIYRLKKDKLNYGVSSEKPPLPIYEHPSSSFIPCCSGYQETRSAEDYLRTRNISAETQKKFGVGISNHRDLGIAITIPILFKGIVRSIYYSEIKNGGLKRYPAGSPQGRILFNYDECVKVGKYIMVESILDVLMIDSLGVGPAMACFTNMVSDDQLDLLKPFDEHCVYPDMDSARGWDLVTRMVSGLDKSIMLILPPAGKDPGDCEPWEVMDSFARIRRYSDIEIDNLISSAMGTPSKVTGIIKR